MIELRGLAKVYDGKPAVRDLTFTVGAGQIFGFIGPNGAGKTTTLRMLATLLKPTAGSGRVCGFDIRTQQVEVRRRIGYMPDFFGVYEDMRVVDYLRFFAAAYGLDPDERSRIVPDVLELTDLTPLEKALIGDLSRGQQQRIALARCLVHDPPVLLLDEPASGLDPRARLDLLDILRELRSMGKTILISSHILSELADVSDLFGIVERGKLVASGTLAELTHGLVERRVRLEVGGDDGGADRARALLAGHPQVGSVAVADRQPPPGAHDGAVTRLDVTLAADAGAIDFVAALVVGAGLPLTHLSEVTPRLEEVFLRLTEGREA